jgi:prepilin-type N-terminal cleavage/methylation domain-containing protein
MGRRRQRDHDDRVEGPVIKRPKRLLADESGFSLPEVLVTIMIMTTVMFALYSLFDMSLRVFGFGNSKVEATENARLGLERMEREIRAAYPINKPGGDATLFPVSEWTPASITFGNDLNGDKQTPPCVAGQPCEIVNYEVFQPSGSTTYALGRANDAAGTFEPVIEYVDYADPSNTGLRFRYYEADGTTEVVPGSGDEGDIDMVRIELRVEVDRAGQPATQTLSTDVALRNRGNGVAPAPPPTAAPACSDGIDNDGDGKTDFPDDPGCASPSDTDETDPAPPPDTTPHNTIIDSNPPDPDSSTTADFTFSSTESGSTFECRLDGGSWSACTSPTQYTSLSSGSHTFEVRATDAAGNTDPTPASYTWTVSPAPPVDTTPPETTITSGPAQGSSTTSTSASFGFTSSESGSTFECRLDGSAWSSCSSPRPYNGLSVGSHTFEVRATDTAGNTDPTPASRTWTVAAANRPPVAVNDGSQTNPFRSVQRRQTVTWSATFGVIRNDSDPDSDPISVVAGSVTTPVDSQGRSRGTVTLNANGSGSYTAPTNNFTGTVTFRYTISDGRGGTSTATVFIRVGSNDDDDD